MSTGVDAHRRPSLWSYISFGSSPRRRSISLPTRTTWWTSDDPFEKADRHSSVTHSDSVRDRFKIAWMAQSPRSKLIKTAGIVVFVLLLLFSLLPGERESVREFVGGHSSHGQTSSSVQTRCAKSYSSSKPLIQYALMIDAGSTGSRIHVYRFNNCGPTPELEDEMFKMTEKKAGGSGLSSYKEDAEGAAESLDVLMEAAMNAVPVEYRSCSPVAVKATAGLRMLGDDMSKKILDAVRHRLETVYPFPVVSKEKNGVQIMDGKDEGVFAWITTNYLLGKIGGPDKSPTAAVFDLGGGSTQIVFEPAFKGSPHGGMPETMAEGDHKYELEFGGQNFLLYQHSHLGYGLMAARDHIHKIVVQSMHESNPLDSSWTSHPVHNPCLPPGMSRDITVKLDATHPLGKEVQVKMQGPAEPTPAMCRGLAEKMLNKEEKCLLAPCSFNGVHQPSLSKTFAREDVFIFSYFYDRTQPLGMPESFTIRELAELTARVCAGEDSWSVFEGVEGAMAELKDRPEWCLDLSFMTALLHTGYEMPIDREVKIAKRIKGNEVGWCLGASLPLLDQDSAGWKCRIREVS